MIDNIIIFCYLLLVLFIGLYYRSRSNNLQEYSKVGKVISNNKLILLATIFATSVGGGTTFGISEKTFSGNLSFSYALLLTVPIDIMIALYIVPKIVKFYGAITIGDIMVNHYGPAGKILTGIAAALVSIGYLAAQISVSARIFEYFLSINYFSSIILSYVIVILYTAIGGLKSVVLTDLLQFFMIVVSIPILLIIGVKEIGGVTEFIANIPANKYILNKKLLSDTFIVALSFSVMGLHPTFIQRILISKDAKSIQNAIYRKIFIYVIFIIIITSIGLVANILVPYLKPSQALPYLIDSIIPTGLKGFVISGLLASVMSTADSDLNIASVSIVNDIFKPLTMENNHKNLLLIAQITTVILGSIAILIALKFHDVIDLVIFVAGFWSPMIFVPLIATLYNKNISVSGFLCSAILGATSFTIWELYFVSEYRLSGLFVGTLVSLIIFITARVTSNNKILLIKHD